MSSHVFDEECTLGTYTPTSRRDQPEHLIKFLEINETKVYLSPHFPCNLISEKIVEEFDLPVRATTPKELYSDFTRKLVVNSAVVLTPLFRVDDGYLAPNGCFYIAPISKIPGSSILFGVGYGGKYGMKFSSKGVSFDKQACQHYEIDENALKNRIRYVAGQLRI